MEPMIDDCTDKTFGKLDVLCGSIEQESTLKTALNGLLMLSKTNPNEMNKKSSMENIENQTSIFLTPCASPTPGM